MKAKHLLPLLLLAASTPWTVNAAVDPFYQSLLRDGQAAFERKDYGTAVRELRLACFGMLDEPKVLADCLARLALAQDRTNDVEGFRATFQRLADVEERFKAYSQGNLPPELRTGLEQRLSARLPAATLQSAPAAFRPPAAPAAPAQKPAQKPAQAPVSSTTAAPASTRETTRTSTDPAGTGTVELVESMASVIPPDAKPLTEEERRKLIQARQLLAERRAAKELREAYQLAREVADAHPDLKEAQHLAAEGAYRISRWSDATTYFRRGGDPGENEPERLFYMAVSLYESGDAAGAAAALKRALPNLKRTAYVDSYVQKIQGQ
jgi:tetratricopeptide (TPR) repeat protein